VFSVQVQHPRCDIRLFDLVIAPQHDFVSPKAASAAASEQDSHVCVTRAALHRLDATALAAGALLRGVIARSWQPCDHTQSHQSQCSHHVLTLSLPRSFLNRLRSVSSVPSDCYLHSCQSNHRDLPGPVKQLKDVFRCNIT
jgi:hypothetical protein